VNYGWDERHAFPAQPVGQRHEALFAELTLPQPAVLRAISPREIYDAGRLPPPVDPAFDTRRQQAIREIQDEEDRHIFDALDAIASEGWDPLHQLPPPIFTHPRGQPTNYNFIDFSYVRDPLDPSTTIQRVPGITQLDRAPQGDPERLPGRVMINPSAIRALGFQVSEHVGMGVVNAEATRRVSAPEFEIASNPSISLSAVTARRFDMIEMIEGRSEDPQIPVRQMPLHEMEQIALVFRRTAWERLMIALKEDNDSYNPQSDGHAQVTQKIDQEVLDVFLETTESDLRRTMWQRLGELPYGALPIYD
jgi:hypothetical protein